MTEINRDEMTGSDCSIVAIGRTGTAPLRFKGKRQVARRYETDVLQANLALWRCATGGYVAHLELMEAGQRQSHAHRVGTVREALSFFASLRSRMPDVPEPQPGKKKRQSIDAVAKVLLKRSRTLSARDALEQLIEDFSDTVTIGAL